MKDLYGTSNRAKHRAAATHRTKHDAYVVGYDYEGFTVGDAAYLFNRTTGEFSFQHMGNKEAAIQKLMDTIKTGRH